MNWLIILCVSLGCLAYTKQVDEIQHKLNRIVASVDPNVRVGLEVVSLKNGLVLYQKDQNKLFLPASTLKTFTAAAALSILGVDYRFETHLYIDGNDLYLKGSGDPSLTLDDLNNLAFQLKLQGIHEIEGDLIVDHSEFDDVSLGPGWMWDDGSSVDALTVNRNCIDLWIRPAASLSLPPLILLDPETDYVSVSNRALTEKKGALKISKRFVTKEKRIEIGGNIRLNASPEKYSVAVDAPNLYAGYLLKQCLQAQGIDLKGHVRTGLTPQLAKSNACHPSSPLSVLVETMMKNSDDLYASCLFKKLGAYTQGAPGTWEKGARAVRAFLSKEAGLNVHHFTFVDGSGESRYNLISPHQMVQFLTWVHKQFAFAPEFLTSLPISGTDGTLKTRMCAIKGKVRAKTGCMTGVSTLAGYIVTETGEWLAFSFCAEGILGSTDSFKTQLEDTLCQALSEY